MNQHEFFYDIAKAAANQSTCISSHYGAVIADPTKKTLISTGFNGVPRGKEHCCEREWCFKRELGFDHFQSSVKDWIGLTYCLCTHAEANAIIQAGSSSYGKIMYLYGERHGSPLVSKPCFLCTKMIINAGIDTVITKVNQSFIEINMNELYDKYIQEIIMELNDVSLNLKLPFKTNNQNP